MAINISTLKPKSIGTTLLDGTSTYRDLADVFEMKSTKSQNQFLGDSLSKDLSTDVDYKAISNSLQNIFNTSPGEKILNPAFGADLKRYLFEPIDETTAEVVGNVIVKAIKLYEPRVTLENVQVIARPDDNEYIINIYLKIPSLKSNKSATFSGTLSSAGVRTNDTTVNTKAY